MTLPKEKRIFLGSVVLAWVVADLTCLHCERGKTGDWSCEVLAVAAISSPSCCRISFSFGYPALLPRMPPLASELGKEPMLTTFVKDPYDVPSWNSFFLRHHSLHKKISEINQWLFEPSRANLAGAMFKIFAWSIIICGHIMLFDAGKGKHIVCNKGPQNIDLRTLVFRVHLTNGPGLTGKKICFAMS